MKQRSKILTALFLSASLAVTPAASVSVLAENLDVAAVEDVTVVPEEEISDSTDDSDLTEDMAAEQKARAVYENLIDLTNDPDVIGPLLFLRQREVVHYNLFKALFDEYQEKSQSLSPAARGLCPACMPWMMQSLPDRRTVLIL